MVGRELHAGRLPVAGGILRAPISAVLPASERHTFFRQAHADHSRMIFADFKQFFHKSKTVSCESRWRFTNFICWW